jgi:DNA-binding GntR family transcriptional regulator
VKRVVWAENIRKAQAIGDNPGQPRERAPARHGNVLDHSPLKKMSPRPTEADRVFDEIVGDILSGALRPRERLAERDLVSRFGVSRTPVREAIKRLFERGFVEAGPKGVAVVVDVGADDLRKLYDLRIELESSAAAATAANITAAEIDQLRRANRDFGIALGKRDLVRMLAVRAQFHGIVARATRNRWLADILIMLRERSYVVRHFHWQDASRAAQTLRLHDEMINALENRKTQVYHRLLIQQIQAAIDTYQSQLRVPEAAALRSANESPIRPKRAATK